MRLIWLVAGLAVVGVCGQMDSLVLDPDHAAIQWTTAPTSNVIDGLNARLKNGEVRLEGKGSTGYLADILKALEIPVSSQMLAYANASLQGKLIRPENPRALYFNDAVAVGAVGGSALLEVAVHDPKQGVVFYTLNQNPSNASKTPPQFVRQTFCTMCHETELGVPGMILHSVPTGADGTALFQLGAWDANDRTAFENRWGGWYVTGRHAPFAHMGNQLIADWHKPETLAPAAPARANVEARWNSNYLTNTSDIVALLVFEHQAETLNWITRVGWHARIAAGDGKPAESTLETAAALVDSMLFVGEVALPVKVGGTSGFAEEFGAKGPRDKQGRSLRDFDLERRVFRYPMSYLIYSAAFDALPAVAKGQVYDRLWQVLSGKVHEARYGHLTKDVRRAIVEILRETKTGLPSYFDVAAVQ